MAKRWVWFFLMLFIRDAKAVCTELRYGTAEQALQIEQAMAEGTVEQAVAAIRVAQHSRGQELGCPESERLLTSTLPLVMPEYAEIVEAWALHRSVFEQRFNTQCPPLGRRDGSLLLGGLLGAYVNLGFDQKRLSDGLSAFESTQFRPVDDRTAPIWAGMFGYAKRYGQRDDPCFVNGVVSESINQLCELAPQLCVSFDHGRWAGQSFGIGDIVTDLGFYDGGGAYDHGWAGVMMIEAAKQQVHPKLYQRYRRSALLAADWAVQDPSVRNHNYTAKLIWLLAVAYDWSGQEKYREALVDKLRRNLLPAVLMDQNNDGRVDGVPQVSFSDLVDIAQTPGRMWDAHNSIAWYQAMNSWAMLEAYISFRDRGQHQFAAMLRPYAIAMLDNLANEIITTDIDLSSGPGSTQPAFAIVSGLWKLADVEGLDRLAWERAAGAYWQTGFARFPGERRTALLSLYLLRVAGVEYLRTRQPFAAKKWGKN